MKVNKFIFVCLLLAILTVGAVSADDSSDNLTVADSVIETDNDDVDLEVSQDSAIESSDDVVDLSYSEESAVVGKAIKDSEISVNAPKKIKALEESKITVTLPKAATGYIYSSFDGGDDEYNDYYIDEGVSEIGFTFNQLGIHTIDLRYSGDDVYDGRVIWSGKYNITDFIMPVSTGSLVYGETAEIGVYMPDYAEGNLTLKINGKTYEKQIYGGDYEFFEVSDLKFGDNKYTFTYSGDDNYKSKVVSGVVTTYPEIIIPYDVYYNEPANVTLNLPTNAKGNLVVKFSDKTYKAKVSNGKAVVLIPSTDLGYFDIEAYYDGTDYEVREMFDCVSIYPSVTLSRCMWVKDKNSVVFEVPKSHTGKLTVTIDEEPYKTVNVKNGKATVQLSGLSVGEHYIYLEYEDDYYSYTFDTDFTLRENSPYINLEVNASSEVIKGETVDLYTNVPDDYDGDITVLVDGIDNGGESIDTSELAYGKHTVKFVFENDSYYKSESKSLSFNVVHLRVDIPDEIVVNGYEPLVNVYAAKDVRGNITIYVDGKRFKMMPMLPSYYYERDFVYCYDFDMSSLSIGNHTIKVAYSGDKTHDKITKSGKVNVIYEIAYEIFDGIFYYGSENAIRAEIPGDASKAISVKIDGKAFKNIIEEDDYDTIRHFEVNISDLALGEHTIQISYPGDEKYSSLKVSDKFSIIPMISFESSDIIGEGRNAYVSLKLPENAKGKLVVTLDNGKKYTKALSKGFANISIDNLPMGDYDINAYYTGSDYEVQEENFWLYVDGQYYDYDQYYLNKPGYFYLKMPKDAKGSIIVKMDGKQFKKQKLVNGEANVTIDPQFGYHNFEIFYSGNDYEFSYESSWSLSPVDVLERPIFKGDAMVLEIPKDAKGKVTVTINGKAYDPKFVNGIANFTPTNLKINENEISIKYAGSDYGDYEDNMTFWIDPEVTVGHNDVYERLTWSPAAGYALSVANLSSQDNIVVDIGGKYNGEYVVVIDDDFYSKGKLSNGIANISLSKAKQGIRQEVFIHYEYAKGKYECLVFFPNIKKAPKLSITADDVYDGQKVNIVASASKDLTGNAILNINNKNYTLKFVNGKANLAVSKLKVGKYPISVKFVGNKDFASDNVKASVSVLPKVNPGLKVSVSDSKVGQDAIINVSANSEIDQVTVKVNNVNHEVKLVDGKGSLSVSDLKYGSYDVSASFGGNSKFSAQNASATFKVTYEPKIAAKATSVLYSAKGKYSVTVYGEDGKVAKNINVVFKINGKKVKTVKTNSNGVATYTVTKTPGTYKISATALGKTVTRKLTVKHVVSLKTVKVKKSARKLVLTATLKKVNKKMLKNKKVTFKFNGKKYVAKTDKKGVAKVTIKKVVLKKLKVGKKVTYQATYLKDTVKKTAKVKK
ncbi:hypothetical protein [Methanobrevibacter sp.]|uniref:hypothetical protein n=1 Tax=Methanobrevibacter sp. TaxID=66852 RepID=UPI00386603F6